MSNEYTGPVADSIKTRLDELKQEEEQLTQALRALQGTKSPAPASPRRRGGGRRKATTAKRGPKTSRSDRGGKTRADEIHSFLSENPGKTGSEIGKALKMTNPHTYGTLKKMLDDGKVKKAADKTYTAV